MIGLEKTPADLHGELSRATRKSALTAYRRAEGELPRALLLIAVTRGVVCMCVALLVLYTDFFRYLFFVGAEAAQGFERKSQCQMPVHESCLYSAPPLLVLLLLILADIVTTCYYLQVLRRVWPSVLNQRREQYSSNFSDPSLSGYQGKAYQQHTVLILIV